MLNRTPPGNTNTTNTLNAYRKRRQFFRGPFLIYSAAALLLIVGIGLVVSATRGGNNPLGGLFASDTPTATLTFTSTVTITPSITPTITFTPTVTLTPTPSAPFSYTIVEGDLLETIAEKFNLGPDGVPLILEYNSVIAENGGQYNVGQTITIPPPGTVLKTPTPLPSGVREIDYVILPGDTLAGLAVRFNSTEEDIITRNNIENPNVLNAGVTLKIRINLVTATPTLPSTSTPVSPTVAGQPTQGAATATGSGPVSTTCTPSENAAFVTELQTLINNVRTNNGLSALTFNDKLASAAKAHATDMICNNYLSHIGLNNSTPEDRVEAQGYTASEVVENLYALHPAYGINPQTALDWWMNDPVSKANILNSNVTEFGISYQFSEQSLLGGYFVVVFAKP